ncbi:MAG TPA: MgtC/SapB family protein, partial [Acidimicrobiia bacterium]|nr:MgtC/SapB family protein [Acidimicrobiia bacterium]
VRGLTTAASLWVTAAVGLAVGIGYETSAVAVTGATLISLVGLRSVRRVVRHRLARKEEQAVVRLLPGADPGLVVQAIHAVAGLDVRSVRIERDEETGTLVVEFNAVVAAGSLEEAVAPLAGLDGVDEVYVTGAL